MPRNSKRGQEISRNSPKYQEVQRHAEKQQKLICRNDYDSFKNSDYECKNNGSFFVINGTTIAIGGCKIAEITRNHKKWQEIMDV